MMVLCSMKDCTAEQMERYAARAVQLDYLRDAGMSRTEAKALLSRMKNLGQRDADDGLTQLAETIRRNTQLIKSP